MEHTMARVEVADFDTWLRVHRANAEHRRAFGIIDGPIYQDIDEPNAVLVHTLTEDPSRAAQWFQTEAFKQATRASGALRRTFYTATEQDGA
jgi:heme-degrading monooxygenase HmoA